MKKFMILTIFVLTMMTGCKALGLESFKEAMDTTASITKGVRTVEVEVKNTFDKEDITVDELKAISVAEDLKTKVKVHYDNTKDIYQHEGDVYVYIQGYGTDSSFYISKEKQVVYVDLLGKYIDLQNMGNFDVNSTKGENINDTSMTPDFTPIFEKLNFMLIQDKFREVLSEKDVVVGQNEYIWTSEGKLKTTTYLINLSDKQIKSIVSVMEAQIDKKLLANIIGKSFGKYIEEEKYVERIFEDVDKIEFEKVEGIAYVDFDGRLVKEEYVIVIDTNQRGSGALTKMEMKLSILSEHLGKDLPFNIPNVTKENTFNYKEERK